MTAPVVLSAEELCASSDRHLGYSDWRLITQESVNLFADATDDHQWIHVDPERAAAGPYGGCVAHGFLTLALLTPLVSQIFEVKDTGHAINHRVDRVRFRAPLLVGARVRAGAKLLSARMRARSHLEVTLAVTFETVDATVVCTAEQITLYPGQG